MFLNREFFRPLLRFCLLVVLLAIPAAGAWYWLWIQPVESLDLKSTRLQVTVLLEGLEIPWDMDMSPDGWLWFSERNGRISRYLPESGPLQEVHFIDEVYLSPDNSGLHALALHPRFPAEPFVFVHYTDAPENSRLVRFRFDSETQSLEDPVVLLDDIAAHLSHNGSRIVFSADGRHLFVSLGDAFNPPLAQDLESTNGKILRLDLDGGIPADNPFPGSPVWTLGHRNPQGLVLAGNGLLYSSEHGASRDDELNIIEQGRNYGHPGVRGMCDLPEERERCAGTDITEPIWTWSPTAGVAGIGYYDHPAIPEWRNAILATTLKTPASRLGKRLYALHLSDDGRRITSADEYLFGEFGRLREVMATDDGRVFLFTSNRETNKWNRPRLPNIHDDRLIMLKNSAYRPAEPATR